MRRIGTEDRRDSNSRRLRNAADGRHPLGLLVEQLTRRTVGRRGLHWTSIHSLHLSEPPRSFGSINTIFDVITLYSASSFPVLSSSIPRVPDCPFHRLPLNLVAYNKAQPFHSHPLFPRTPCHLDFRCVHNVRQYQTRLFKFSIRLSSREASLWLRMCRYIPQYTFSSCSFPRTPPSSSATSLL